jgi:hypothetical protein
MFVILGNSLYNLNPNISWFTVETLLKNLFAMGGNMIDSITVTLERFFPGAPKSPNSFIFDLVISSMSCKNLIDSSLLKH